MRTTAISSLGQRDVVRALGEGAKLSTNNSVSVRIGHLQQLSSTVRCAAESCFSALKGSVADWKVVLGMLCGDSTVYFRHQKKAVVHVHCHEHCALRWRCPT